MSEEISKTKRPQQARGLPAGFGMGAPLARRPVQLGDYLDDAPAAAPPRAAEPAGPVVEEPEEQEQAELAPEPDPIARKPKRPVYKSVNGPPSTLPASARSRFVRRGPPRKQINMRPATLDRARELLWLVQEYGPQPDAKASEMFEALVDLLYESRHRLSLAEVPLRGKWGEASAREFPQHLKRAFAHAILAGLAEEPAVRTTAMAA